MAYPSASTPFWGTPSANGVLVALQLALALDRRAVLAEDALVVLEARADARVADREDGAELCILGCPAKAVGLQARAPHQPLHHGGIEPFDAAQRRLARHEDHQGQDGEDYKICSTSKICHLKINQEIKGSLSKTEIGLTLSNLKVQATKKNESCIPTVTMAHIARLFESLSNTNIFKSVRAL